MPRIHPPSLMAGSLKAMFGHSALGWGKSRGEEKMHSFKKGVVFLLNFYISRCGRKIVDIEYEKSSRDGLHWALQVF